MTGFKPGDRVHVEFDAVVDATLTDDHCWIKRPSGMTHVMPNDCLTLILPAVAVGDDVTSLDGVPDGAILKDKDNQPWWVYESSAKARRIPAPEDFTSSGPMTVLWLPDTQKAN